MKANRFELRIRIRIRGCKDENSAFASESAELEIWHSHAHPYSRMWKNSHPSHPYKILITAGIVEYLCQFDLTVF